MAAVDFFLKIDGIDGESSDAKHKGEIELESWSWSEYQTGAHAAGGGGGAGKVHFQDIHFTSTVSKASPLLFLACATGEHYKKAVLTCRKAGKEQQEYLKIILTDILVSSFQLGGSAGGGLLPVDHATLNIAKFEFEYKPQNADGTLGASVKGGYDVKSNQKV
jgi:type VI secretion system secreted protein Hcp